MSNLILLCIFVRVVGLARVEHYSALFYGLSGAS